MRKKHMTVGKFARDSEIPLYSDGRCILTVPVICTGTEKQIALAEKLRKKYLNDRADALYEELSSLSVSQMNRVFEQFQASSLSELVYGFLNSAEQHLMTLNDAQEVIDDVVRCNKFPLKLNAKALVEPPKK